MSVSSGHSLDCARVQRALWWLVIGVVALSTAACHRADSDEVSIDGSSTVFPITAAVVEDYHQTDPAVRLPVRVSGTSGGLHRFLAGSVDIAAASRAIKPAEAATARRRGLSFVEVPVAFDGLCVVVNRDNYWADALSVEDLRRMFLGGSAVRRWRDVRPQWPDEPIRFYAPGLNSGTLDYFKGVLLQGRDGELRADMTLSEDDHVLVRGVSQHTGGIGFFGSAYYFRNRDSLRALAIVAEGEVAAAVTPTPEAIQSGRYRPFSRPLFLYVNRASLDRPAVRAFVNYYLDQSPRISHEVGYVPLSDRLTQSVRRRVADGTVGSELMRFEGRMPATPFVELYR